jgi:hypothetical protein
VLFAANDLVLPALGAGFLAACVAHVVFFYGDDAAKVCFVFDRSRLSFFEQPRKGTGNRRPARPLVGHRVTHDTN